MNKLIKRENRVFKELINEGDSEKIEEKWKEIKIYNIQSTYTLYLTYLLTFDIEKALEFFRKMGNESIKIKKRHTFPIFLSLFSEKSSIKAINFYKSEINKKFELNEQDAQKILPLCFSYGDMIFFLNLLQSNLNYISYNFAKRIGKQYKSFIYPIVDNSCNGVKLEKLPTSPLTKSILLDNIQYVYLQKYNKETKNMINFIKKSTHNIILDGANILYSAGKVTFDSYKLLNKIYMQLLKSGYKPIVVLCNKHYKNIKKFPKDVQNVVKYIYSVWKCNSDLYETPVYINDDCIFIYIAISLNAQVVSNDKFRDHIFKISFKDFNNDVLKRWIRDNVITFVGDKLTFPPPYSRQIQVIEDKYYIPTDNNMFLVVKI